MCRGHNCESVHKVGRSKRTNEKEAEEHKQRKNQGKSCFGRFDAVVLLFLLFPESVLFIEGNSSAHLHKQYTQRLSCTLSSCLISTFGTIAITDPKVAIPIKVAVRVGVHNADASLHPAVFLCWFFSIYVAGAYLVKNATSSSLRGRSKARRYPSSSLPFLQCSNAVFIPPPLPPSESIGHASIDEMSLANRNDGKAPVW